MRILILMISMFMLGFASVFAFAKPPVLEVPIAQVSCNVIGQSMNSLTTADLLAANSEFYCSNISSTSAIN